MSQNTPDIPMVAAGRLTVSGSGVISGQAGRTLAGNRAYVSKKREWIPSAAKLSARDRKTAVHEETSSPPSGYSTIPERCWPERRKSIAMPRTQLSAFRAFVVGLSLATGCGLAGQAAAFDPRAGVSRESGPFDLFKFGFSAYKNGRKDEAVEAYKYAAEKGHTGSRWALANMYQSGDGVAEDDFEAFKIYSEIAQQGIEPGSADTGYFVNALISLANYYRRGIAGSPVQPDLSTARQLYFQAASTFGVPEAQFQLARMILAGDGGRADVQQAKKWLNRARKNGHAGAMGVFGSVIFDEGQTVRGLAFLTAALDQCSPQDRIWLRDLQERAFSLSNEEDRRVAVALAQDMHLNDAD